MDSALHIEDNPFNLPNTGDLIEFWDHEKKKRYVARVLNMHRSARRRCLGWRNVIVLSSRIKMAINLDIYSDNRLAWRQIHTLPEEDGNLPEENENNLLNIRVTVSNNLCSGASQEDISNDQQPVNNHPYLSVPEDAHVIPNKVYKLPDSIDNPLVPVRRQHKPKFTEKLNLFKKKNM